MWTLTEMRDNIADRRVGLLPHRLCWKLSRRSFRAMNHKKCSLGLIRLYLLFAVALTLAVPASAEWKEKVLYSFQGGANDGAGPVGGVVFDKQGNLYGVLQFYGPGSCGPIGNECGTVFQLAPPAQKGDPWTETLLYKFGGKGVNDGESPNSGLIIDSLGNLYGVTAYGGTGDCVLLGVPAGCGTVYEISPPKQKGGAWKETILYSFPTTKHGYVPIGNLVFDGVGNLYGATLYGGTKGTTCDGYYGGQCGTVFELSPPKTKGGKWMEKVLHSFAGVAQGKQYGDGANPNGGLVLDSKGAVYGTTFAGGSGDWGTAFELRPPTTRSGLWTEKMLHRFQGSRDGVNPAAGLTFGSNGDLYGTTLTGGPGGGGGTVFRLTPPAGKSGTWQKTILHGFNGTGGGLDAESPVVFAANGSLYGTTLDSGGAYYGTVFRLKPPKQRGDPWTFTMLYGFQAPPDGGQPAAGLIFDKNGNLYSTTTQGGVSTGCSFRGCGTVYEVSP